MAFKKEAATVVEAPKTPAAKPPEKTNVSRALAQKLVKHCGDIRFYKLHPANRKVQDMILELAASFGE